MDAILWAMTLACAGTTLWFSFGAPPPGANLFEGADKVGHAIAYFATTVSFLFAAVWRPGRGEGRFGHLGIWFPVVAIAAGAVVEYPPGLDADARSADGGSVCRDHRNGTRVRPARFHALVVHVASCERSPAFVAWIRSRSPGSSRSETDPMLSGRPPAVLLGWDYSAASLDPRSFPSRADSTSASIASSVGCPAENGVSTSVTVSLGVVIDVGSEAGRLPFGIPVARGLVRLLDRPADACFLRNRHRSRLIRSPAR